MNMRNWHVSGRRASRAKWVILRNDDSPSSVVRDNENNRALAETEDIRAKLRIAKLQRALRLG